MLTTMKLHSAVVIRTSIHLLAAGALISALAYGQPVQNRAEKTPGESKSEKIARMIEEAGQDKDNTGMGDHDVEELAKAGAVQAIPMLEEKFARMPYVPSKYPSWDTVHKAHVASALVRLGDKNEIYWDYLVKQAALVVESDAPNPTSTDSKGKSVISPEFIAWVSAHKLDHPGVSEEYTYLFPMAVSYLALTGDPRAVPVLRRGLLSPNYLVQSSSADGLAQIGDEASVPLIIEACRKAPADAAAVIARALVYFDDREAQNAVDKYMSRDEARSEREERARGTSPTGIHK